MAANTGRAAWSAADNIVSRLASLLPRRLVRSSLSLAVVLATFWAYRCTVAPWIVPPAAPKPGPGDPNLPDVNAVALPRLHE